MMKNVSKSLATKMDWQLSRLHLVSKLRRIVPTDDDCFVEFTCNTWNGLFKTNEVVILIKVLDLKGQVVKLNYLTNHSTHSPLSSTMWLSECYVHRLWI